MSDLQDLTAAMREFSRERDWEQFHDPKSLVLALVGEVGELAELVQWLPAGDAQTLVREGPRHTRVGEELSDILLYVVRLADVCGVDLAAASRRKLAAAAKRFPVGDVHGRAPSKE